MTYRLSHNHRKEPGIETQLSVRKAAKGAGEEEKESGKGTEKNRAPRGSGIRTGTGGGRPVGQGLMLNGAGTSGTAPLMAAARTDAGNGWPSQRHALALSIIFWNWAGGFVGAGGHPEETSSVSTKDPYPEIISRLAELDQA